MIMDGNFTKTLYTTEHFTMNGIYLLFPVEIHSIQPFINQNKYNGESKYIMKFVVTENDFNQTLLENIYKIEKSLLEYYVEYHTSNHSNMYTHTHMNHAKRKIYSLSDQLQQGSVKFYSRNAATHMRMGSQPSHYFIKISGLWENSSEIGITYKILER